MSQNIFFFKKNTICHSFCIIVIPSVLLSFLPDYWHSFRITVISSILKLWDTQGYLWLFNDLAEVKKLIGETFERKIYFFSKKYFMSFLPHYCHSFHITVIPSGVLSFLPYYCHSFVLVSFLPNIVIPRIIAISNICHPK